MTKKITPSDLRRQSQQMISEGTMPSVEQVLKAVSETRRKYRPIVLAARKDKASQ
jgi:hypothetical protein